MEVAGQCEKSVTTPPPFLMFLEIPQAGEDRQFNGTRGLGNFRRFNTGQFEDSPPHPLLFFVRIPYVSSQGTFDAGRKSLPDTLLSGGES